MRRRICLVGTALAAVPLAVGISAASAAPKSNAPKPAAKTKTVVLRCHISLGVVPPAGSPAVDQPPTQGAQYGVVHCGGRSFGFGVEKSTFTVPDSGDTVGTYAQYFGSGSIRGKFDLIPGEQSGDLTTTGFASQSWTGTVTVTSGTGTLAKAAGKKGVLKCTSDDTVHLTCTERLKLKQL